jgi:hypothetical protein
MDPTGGRPTNQCSRRRGWLKCRWRRPDERLAPAGPADLGGRDELQGVRLLWAVIEYPCEALAARAKRT